MRTIALVVTLALCALGGPLSSAAVGAGWGDRPRRHGRVAQASPPRSGPGTPRTRWIDVTEPGGERLRAAVAWPEGTGPVPLVLVLHGTEGFHEEYVHLAEAFANAGFLAMAGCWFAGDECPRGPVFSGVTRETTRHVQALIGAALGLARARAGRVALVGHSRGGMLALVAASTGAEVQAIVVSSAQLAPGYTAGRRPRPIDVPPITLVSGLHAPVLILHGAGDETVDVREALAYEGAVRELGGLVEAHYYATAVHRLVFAPATRDDVLHRSIEFLRRHLLF